MFYEAGRAGAGGECMKRENNSQLVQPTWNEESQHYEYKSVPVAETIAVTQNGTLIYQNKAGQPTCPIVIGRETVQVGCHLVTLDALKRIHFLVEAARRIQETQE